MTTILLVEDEPGMRNLIGLWLERSGYQWSAASAGREALRLFYNAHPDLVLLDVGLPDMDGWQLCERIRELSQAPIIMLTARADESDKVRGLQMGADDYVTKPFGFPELLARIQAVLRRAPTSQTTEQIYREGDLLLDTTSHRVMLDGADLKLTPTEYRLLSLLMQRRGQLLTHRQILAEVWGHEYSEDMDSLRMYIRSLRRKLASGGANYIETEHGLGYRFRKSNKRADGKVTVQTEAMPDS